MNKNDLREIIMQQRIIDPNSIDVILNDFPDDTNFEGYSCTVEKIEGEAFEKLTGLIPPYNVKTP